MSESRSSPRVLSNFFKSLILFFSIPKPESLISQKKNFFSSVGFYSQFIPNLFIFLFPTTSDNGDYVKTPETSFSLAGE